MIALAKLAETTPLSDEAIVASVLAGETALYEVLVRRHNQKVYRAVRAVLRDDAESEDVMQHAYVAAFTHLLQFRGGALFSTWLVRIAVHEALARLRRRGRFVEWVDPERGESVVEAVMGGQDPEQQTGARELGVVLEALVEELPAHFRAVFVLREVEGMSTAEVALALELSEDNVKARLHRAKTALRERLTRRLGAAAVHVWRFEAPRCDAVAARVMAQVGLLRAGGELP